MVARIVILTAELRIQHARLRQVLAQVKDFVLVVSVSTIFVLYPM